MKKFSKILSVALLVALVLSLGVNSAFAADDFKLTINNTVSGHVYTAYQIFTGTKADHTTDSQALGDAAWGSDITEAGKKALYTAYNMTVADDKLDETENILALMEAIADEDNADASASDKAVRFANVFFTTTDAGNVSANEGLLNSGTSMPATGESVVFNSLASGYYLVNDSYTPKEGEANGVDYSIARIAVQVVGDTTINNKADKPQVDKKIKAETKDDKGATTYNYIENNTAQIGDTVPYVVTSKVPNYDGYKEYYMDFKDTLSKGLTLDPSSFTVKIGDAILVADDAETAEDDDNSHYTLTVGTYDKTEGTEFTIHLKDLVSRKYTVGAAITIEYSAVVNDKAVIGNAGNPNTIKLEYSNNPSDSGDGTPDNPEDDIPHGTTPEVKTFTFVTEIDITKVDGMDTTKLLAGAVFHVKASTINKVLITGQHYVVATDGTFYKLKDGTYTDKAATPQTEDKYESTETKYKLEDYADTSVAETKDVEFEVVSGANGKIKITGLKEGTYTITEIQAPSGYNLLKDPIVVVISSNIDNITAPEQFKWTKVAGTELKLAMEKNDGVESATNVANGTYQFNIGNNSGTQLPSTGGIGTTIFYVVGGVLVLAAIILLVTKKRMSE